MRQSYQHKLQSLSVAHQKTENISDLYRNSCEYESLAQKHEGWLGFSRSAEYIMRNAGLNEAQAGIKIAQRSISCNLLPTPQPA